MKKNLSLLIRHKYRNLKAKFRRQYFLYLGLKSGNNTQIGDITCDWPNHIIIGDNCNIQNDVDFRISHPFDANNKIEIGNNVFIGRCTELNCQSKITIASNCWIASNTTIVDIYHETKKGIAIHLQPIHASPISIEEDVWIGSRCTILSGITIGQGSIIGAGSLVNKSVPPNEIWAGVPAKFIKVRS